MKKEERGGLRGALAETTSFPHSRGQKKNKTIKTSETKRNETKNKNKEMDDKRKKKGMEQEKDTHLLPSSSPPIQRQRLFIAFCFIFLMFEFRWILIIISTVVGWTGYERFHFFFEKYQQLECAHILEFELN